MQIIKMLNQRKISSMMNQMKIKRSWKVSSMRRKNLIPKCPLQSNFNLMAIHLSNMTLILMLYKLKLIQSLFKIWINLKDLVFVTFKTRNVVMDLLKKILPNNLVRKLQTINTLALTQQ